MSKYDPITTTQYGQKYKDKISALIDRFGVNKSRLSKKFDFRVDNLLGKQRCVLWEPDLIKILDEFHITLEDFKIKNVEDLNGYVDGYLLGRKKKSLYPDGANNLKKHPAKKATPKKTDCTLYTKDIFKESNKFSVESDGREITIKISL